MPEIQTTGMPGGLWERLRASCFYSPGASVVSVALGAVILFVVCALFKWAVLDAVWIPDVNACRKAAGACWGFVAEKWRLIIFGRFPYALQWRPAAATFIIVAMLVVSAVPSLWTHRGVRMLLWGWAAAFAAFFILMIGGIFGLEKISTDMWGGLPLTVILTLVGMAASSPLGILLAIGRRSRLPIISAVSTGYIELVRGVPLITVLFVAAFVFPLLMPEWMKVDAFWRVAIGITLFQAAYMAETVRGGLQTIPSGQFAAARSLGLTERQCYTNVILPQALVAIIPAFVNSLLSCFMDTSLVMVVSMYDLTGSLKLALGDALWRPYFIEGYAFIVMVYFVSSSTISRYSQWLEVKLQGAKSRRTIQI